MNIKKKLLNPFVLCAQGFIAGAILFWSTAPQQGEQPRMPQSVEAAAVAVKASV